MNKKDLYPLFQKDWEKHYKTDFFEEMGFVRKKCSCGKYFWTLDEDRTLCGEPYHNGYTFIGENIGKPLSYKETWEEMASFYKKEGHEILPRYPVVARWRDDLFFTIASIAVFQPYVVRGEADPPANPLLIPQPSLRFKDIQNVGVTNRHYTSFVMVGQHAFNREENIVWKEESLRQMFDYMTEVVGIPPDRIVFHEDVWAGGGNFGPSIEYFVDGLELGNIVFMQYEETPTGFKELNIKVLDHGIGLSRFAWIRSGKITSYEVVFPSTTAYLRKFIDISLDDKTLRGIVRYSGLVDLEEDSTSLQTMEERFGDDWKAYLHLSKIYAISDHLNTLLLAAHDGAYPSNVRGGHNLRILLRRVFSLEKELGIELDYERVLNLLSQDSLFPEVKDSVSTLLEIIDLERKKYEASRKKAEAKVLSLSKKGKITSEDVKLLYESYGITPEEIRTIVNVLVEDSSFYEEMEEGRKKPTKKVDLPDVSDLPPTEPLYYKDAYLKEFEARVLDIREGWVILDKTAFYPEGGGQEYDKGWLNESKVIEVQKKNGVILHRIEGPLPKKGEIVKGKIDWSRRYRLMKHHTATHIILAATRRVLGDTVWQEGAHKGENEAHLDISYYKPLSDEMVRAIELEANRIVMENRDVYIRWMKRSDAERAYGITIYQGGAVPGGTLRIVEIEGVDVEACGGTHVKKTGEVGFIKIVSRSSVADGVERLTYKAGEAAVEYVQELVNILTTTSSIVGGSIKDLPKTTGKLLEKVKKLEKSLEYTKKQLAKLLIERIENNILEVESIDPDTALKVYEEYGRDVVIISRSGHPNLFIFGENAEKLAKIAYSLGAKGGGKKDRYYLTIPSENIPQLLNKLR